MLTNKNTKGNKTFQTQQKTVSLNTIYLESYFLTLRFINLYFIFIISSLHWPYASGLSPYYIGPMSLQYVRIILPIQICIISTLYFPYTSTLSPDYTAHV